MAQDEERFVAAARYSVVGRWGAERVMRLVRARGSAELGQIAARLFIHDIRILIHGYS